MIYFRVTTGFGKEEFVRIDQDDYIKCVNAQVTGKVAILKSGETLSGSVILRVKPDWIRMVGYSDINEVPNYDLDKRTKKLEEYRGFIQRSKKEMGLGVSEKKLLSG